MHVRTVPNEMFSFFLLGCLIFTKLHCAFSFAFWVMILSIKMCSERLEYWKFSQTVLSSKLMCWRKNVMVWEFIVYTASLCVSRKVYLSDNSFGQLMLSSNNASSNNAVVASWLVCSTPERVIRVQALAGDIVLCSWARHFTLTVPLSTLVYLNGYRQTWCWG